VNEPFRVSPWQLALLTFWLSLSVMPFAAPAALPAELGRHAWVPGVTSLALGIWGDAVALSFSRRFPGQPFDAVVLRLMGRILGYPYILAVALLALAGAAVTLNVFASVSGSHELPYLPLAYPALMVAGVGAFAAYFGVEVVARCAEALAPFLAVGLAFVFLSPLYNADFGRLLPLAGLSGEPLPSWAALAALGPLQGFLPVLLVGPFCRPRPRAGWVVSATVAAGVLLAGSLALPVAIFGPAFAARLHYPFLSAAGTVGWAWLPTERILELTLLLWQAVAFLVFAAYLCLGAWLLRRLLPAVGWTTLLLLASGGETLAGAAALAAPWREVLLAAWNQAALLLGLAVPSVLCWLAARRRGGRSRR
jgi:hypothetical protein